MSRKKSKAPPGKKVPIVWVVVAVVIVAAVAMVVAGPFEKKGGGGQSRSFLVRGGETRPVLNPSQFTGMTREAYAAAQAVPQVLDKLYCYCYCDDPPFNHKSLLSCFVEYHGAS